MPYAEGRVYYDADSHVMETSDWLSTYADPDLRERIRPLQLAGAGALADEAVRQADERKAGTVELDAIEEGLLTQGRDLCYEPGLRLLKFAYRSWSKNQFRAVAAPRNRLQSLWIQPRSVSSDSKRVMPSRSSAPSR